MAGAEEYAKLADEEIVQKEKELQEEKKILDSSSSQTLLTDIEDPGGRMEEFADLSQNERDADDMGVSGGGTTYDLISDYLGQDT